jgi:HEAT repeat protein
MKWWTARWRLKSLGLKEATMIASSDLHSSDIASLVSALADGDGSIRQQAREALVQVGPPAVPALAAALGSHQAQVRWEAAKALHDLADPASAGALVTALEDQSFDVRWLAAEGLALLGRKALEPLLTASP